MDKGNNIQRSDLYMKIFNIVKQIPSKEVDGDAPDAISVSHDLNSLFLKTYPIENSMLANKMELLSEDLECIKMWLDDKGAETHDKGGNKYSIIGRIELLLNK